MPSVRPSVVLLVAAALLTGCAEGEETTSQPSEPPSSPAPSSSPPTGGIDVDREHLDVTDVNACALLTATERRDLGLADEPEPVPLVGDPAGMECRFLSADEDSLGFYSIAVWPSRNGASFGDELGSERRHGLVVAGYPATGYHAGEDSPEVCAVGVSVGRNQAIAVARFATGPLLTAERTCDEAHRAAESAVHALLDPARQDELRGDRPGELTVSLGDRPADLDLTDVDSCALVDEETWEMLHVTDSFQYEVHGGSQCDQPGYWSNLEVHYTLLAGRRNAAALAEDADPADVQRLWLSGYPAVWVTGDDPEGCVLAVEVNDGQALVVEHEVYLDEDSLLEPPCEAAAIMATSALRALTADQG
ncbi:DUF3558 domain-containing protein [Actinoalloteichus spitiensis]|uniref:DUF3558 domain-containing protein n=1 Tax=Actinoalloteichus spitiensis TaxID=252394 RepID=UPI00036F6C4E|nr:DUF3558 domain-containing protein [Actinoalloteichus spitiensis]